MIFSSFHYNKYNFCDRNEPFRIYIIQSAFKCYCCYILIAIVTTVYYNSFVSVDTDDSDIFRLIFKEHIEAVWALSAPATFGQDIYKPRPVSNSMKLMQIGRVAEVLPLEEKMNLSKVWPI